MVSVAEGRMDQKMQLKHPQGKKAVRISKEKYDLLKSLLLTYLRSRGESTVGEISTAIKKNLKTRRKHFEGSLAWYLEWVKLDLEARKIISRIPGTSPQQYRVK
jgi:hypothetical protein